MDDGSALERYAEGDAATAALGIRTDSTAEGLAVVSMAVTARHCDQGGRLDRGVAFTVADAAIALASNSYGVPALLVHADAHWLDDVAVGRRVTARAEVVHRRAGTATLESRLVDDEGTVVALVWATTRSPSARTPNG